MGAVVLGIDAAWTAKQPSGVALIRECSTGWQLVRTASSYEAFESDSNTSARWSVPDARSLLQCAELQAGQPVTLVTIDMPLSLQPIQGRRISDDLVSKEYGARHCSTHSPSADRPGRISDKLRSEFDQLGYPLQLFGPIQPGLCEVYPHPALVELLGEVRRLPYKIGKVRTYWPHLSVPDRRDELLQCWSRIVTALDYEISGIADTLPLPSPAARTAELKSFEDMLDAVVCAWVGACALTGKAVPYGDTSSAIWIPVPGHVRWLASATSNA